MPAKYYYAKPLEQSDFMPRTFLFADMLASHWHHPFAREA